MGIGPFFLYILSNELKKNIRRCVSNEVIKEGHVVLKRSVSVALPYVHILHAYQNIATVHIRSVKADDMF
jgi:hypothetical protein